MLGGISHRVRPQVEDQLLRHRPRLKKPPSGGSNSGAASASPPSRFERLTSLKPPALPGDIYSPTRPTTRLRSIKPGLRLLLTLCTPATSPGCKQEFAGRAACQGGEAEARV